MMASWLIKHKVPAALFAASLLLVAGGMAWGYFALRGIAQPLIIHFTERSGITEVGALSSVLLYGVFGLVVCIVNTAIAVPLLTRIRFLGHLLAGATFLVSVLIFIWFAAIISVN
ncbi:MAG: hypothetical protein HYW65_02125 [Candidatus Liptonbacteria bacterium]|nr:hypothetical protein [Candidatus Liptonbacteria bacterium]